MAPAADHPADVVGMDVQPVARASLARHLGDTHVVGVVDQSAREDGDRIGDDVAIIGCGRGRGYFLAAVFFFALAFGGFVSLCFCHIPTRLSRAVALSDGCAPTPSQYSARSSSIVIWDGSVSGL